MRSRDCKIPQEAGEPHSQRRLPPGIPNEAGLKSTPNLNGNGLKVKEAMAYSEDPLEKILLSSAKLMDFYPARLIFWVKAA